MEQGTRTRDGSRIGHPLLQRLASDRERIGDGLLAFGRVDDEDNLAILDQVDNMRTTFDNLVDALAFNAAFTQMGAGSAGCDES